MPAFIFAQHNSEESQLSRHPEFDKQDGPHSAVARTATRGVRLFERFSGRRRALPTLLAERETHFFGCLAKVLLRTCPGVSFLFISWLCDFRTVTSQRFSKSGEHCWSKPYLALYLESRKLPLWVMWHIAEVVVDPVLTDLHKLERKCLIEVTRHGVCVDESSACYVDAAVQECVADLCKRHAG